MIKRPNTNAQRLKRHKRVRAKISGTPECPRLNVFRSEKNIYAQVIDDVNGVTLDVSARRAYADGEELSLSAKEYDLLTVLVRESGSVVTRDDLMREVWGAEWWGSTKTLDMHISWLRRKLGDDATDPRRITTVRGVGFRFETGTES